MYCEDSNTLPVVMSAGNNNRNSVSSSNQRNSQHDVQLPKPPVPSSRGRPYKSLDGSFMQPKHREQSSVNKDLLQVVAKLENLSKENHRAYAMDSLLKHYSSFVNRRKSNQAEQSGYRVYIQYSDEKDTYVVRVEKNTLKAVRDKLPKRGNYRYFFKRRENTCEEVEFDDATVPFYERDGSKQIYCQVFPIQN